MKTKLNIPHKERHQLIRERIPKSNQQQAAISETPLANLFPRPPFLSASSDTHINHGESSCCVTIPDLELSKTIQTLAVIMVLDREGELPLEDLTDDDDKPNKSWRDSVVQCIRGRSVEKVAELLHGRRLSWIKWIEDGQNDKVHIFSSADLLPIGEDSPDDKAVDKKSNTMRSLAVQMANIARTSVYDSPKLTNDKDAQKYSLLLSSLGKAATQCSDMATYVRVNVWLVLAAADVCYQYETLIADGEAEKILRKFLRNYVALVLLCEEISMDGKIVEE